MTNTPVLNIWLAKSDYKKAECKNCYDKLVKGATILSVSRAQGKWASVSNYCFKCSETVLQEVADEVSDLMKRILLIQTKVETEKKESPVECDKVQQSCNIVAN